MVDRKGAPLLIQAVCNLRLHKLKSFEVIAFVQVNKNSKTIFCTLLYSEKGKFSIYSNIIL